MMDRTGITEHHSALDEVAQGEDLARETQAAADDERDTSGRVLDADASSSAQIKKLKQKRKEEKEKKKRRKRRDRGPPSLAFKVQEFCDAHRISRAHYYNLRRQGLAPDETDVGGAVIITTEAASRWRRAREKAARA
jgi:hypothetical protein